MDQPGCTCVSPLSEALGENVSLPFSASKAFLHSLVYDTFLFLQNQQCIIFITLSFFHCNIFFFFFGLPSPLAPAPHPRKPHLPLAPRTPPRSERSPAFQPLAGWVAGAPTPAADLGCLRAAREPLRIRLPGNQRTGEGEGAGGGWGAVEGVLSVWGSLGRPQALPGGAQALAPAPAPPPEASSQAASGSPAGVRTTHSHNHNTHSHTHTTLTHTHTHTHTHIPHLLPSQPG